MTRVGDPWRLRLLDLARGDSKVTKKANQSDVINREFRRLRGGRISTLDDGFSIREPGSQPFLGWHPISGCR